MGLGPENYSTGTFMMIEMHQLTVNVHLGILVIRKTHEVTKVVRVYETLRIILRVERDLRLNIIEVRWIIEFLIHTTRFILTVIISWMNKLSSVYPQN